MEEKETMMCEACGGDIIVGTEELDGDLIVCPACFKERHKG